MFKPQFAPLVEAGAKRQTVRPTPKVLPCPGDLLSLREWTGKPYRSKQRLLRVAKVTAVHEIIITMMGIRTLRLYTSRPQAPAWRKHNSDEFAKADGFPGWWAMWTWFEEQHGLPFHGILIHWE